MNTAEVLNTPGYYYAIAYALSVFVIACTNERKLGRWKLAAVSCVQFALLLFFMTETDGAWVIDGNTFGGTVYSINDGDRRTTSWIYLYM